MFSTSEMILVFYNVYVQYLPFGRLGIKESVWFLRSFSSAAIENFMTCNLIPALLLTFLFL